MCSIHCFKISLERPKEKKTTQLKNLDHSLKILQSFDVDEEVLSGQSTQTCAHTLHGHQPGFDGGGGGVCVCSLQDQEEPRT